MDKKINFFNRHLLESNESYFTHFFHAIGFAVSSTKATIYFFIHAFFPFVFLSNASSTIKKLISTTSLRGKFIEIEKNNNKQIAIIGCGLSGLLTFYNLVKNHQIDDKKMIIKIFDKSHNFPKSIAYSTKNISHLLNVRAILMGVVSVQRDDFFNWLNSKGYQYQKTDFVPRQIFGIYLEDLMNEAIKTAKEKKIEVEFIKKEISEILYQRKVGERKGRKYFVIENDVFSEVVLSIGCDFKSSKKKQINNFWDIDLTKFIDKKEIHILGCSLTAFDAVIALRDLNYQNKIYLHSRRAKATLSHQIYDSSKIVPSPLNLDDAKLEMSEIFHKFVSACKKDQPNWRAVFDAFRSQAQDFWQLLDKEKKQRFLRHAFRFYSIHRHRAPEIQSQTIEKMISSKQLEICKSDKEKISNIDKSQLIDCTGFGYGEENELIENLIKNDIIKKDEIASGFISNDENFYLNSSLNFGTLFEIVAAPEISAMARKIATNILMNN